MSVLNHLKNVASNAVLSTNEKSSIETSISTLETRLDTYFDDEISKHFKFGSSTRETILPRKMDENSDIDYMIVFSDNTYKPQTYLDKLKKFAEKYYYSSIVGQSNPAIVIELSHIKFELVPAIKSSSLGAPYKIPDKSSSYSDWIYTDPTAFNNTLVEKNKNNNYEIKPMIRIVKYWNALSGYPFVSFLKEQDIVSKYYYNSTNLKDYFFEYMLGMNINSFKYQTTKDKVEKAQKIINQTKYYEAQSMNIDAENEIKKLIPYIK
jgi:hypothetical protein